MSRIFSRPFVHLERVSGCCPYPIPKKLVGVDAYNSKHDFITPNQMKPHSPGFTPKSIDNGPDGPFLHIQAFIHTIRQSPAPFKTNFRTKLLFVSHRYSNRANSSVRCFDSRKLSDFCRRCFISRLAGN